MTRNGIMLAVPFEEKRLNKWQPPYIVQPKYDGERCRAVPIGEGKYMLLSSEENPFFSVPHITNAMSSMDLQIESDGELYCHGMTFERIHSIVSRTVNLHPDHKLIKYHIFDYVSEEPQLRRTSELYTMKDRKFDCYHHCIELAPSHICYSLEDVMRTYDWLINKGYEGIIVRHLHAPYLRKRSIYMMKWKGKREDDYKIIGWKEEVSINGDPKERMGALICEDKEGNQFSVGSGMTDEIRDVLWKRRDSVIGKIVKVKYQHLTSGRKVPRFPVFMEVIE